MDGFSFCGFNLPPSENYSSIICFPHYHILQSLSSTIHFLCIICLAKLANSNTHDTTYNSVIHFEVIFNYHFLLKMRERKRKKRKKKRMFANKKVGVYVDFEIFNC